MNRVTQWIDLHLYPAYSKNWDDLLFRERVLSQLRADSTILDLGAGAGIVAQMNFKGLAGRVCGVDLDPRVVERIPCWMKAGYRMPARSPTITKPSTWSFPIT